MFNFLGEILYGTLRYIYTQSQTLLADVKKLYSTHNETKKLKSRIKHLEEAYEYARKRNEQLSIQLSEKKPLYDLGKTNKITSQALKKAVVQAKVARVKPITGLDIFNNKMPIETESETITLGELIKRWQKNEL